MTASRLCVLGSLLLLGSVACVSTQEDPPVQPDGPYINRATVAVGEAPGSLALRDFDGDGELDLAVSNSADDTISLLRGTGEGTFSPHATLSTGAKPRFVTAGDFDGDGDDDIAATNQDDGTVSVFFNDGAASFSAATVLVAAEEPVFIVGADLDDDGQDDLLVTDYGAGALSLFGAQGGGFAARVDFDTGAGPVHAAIADLNGDGADDVVTADRSTPPEVSLLLGDGQGALGAAVAYDASDRPGVIFPIAPNAVAAGDVDSDGHVDVVVANRGLDALDGEVWLLAGDGQGALAAPAELPGVTILAPAFVSLLDLDGDGDLDVVEADHDPTLAAIVGSISGTAYSICTYLGDGAGNFEHSVCLPTGDFPHEVAAGDLNHDGKLDLTVVNAGSNTVTVFLANW